MFPVLAIPGGSSSCGQTFGSYFDIGLLDGVLLVASWSVSSDVSVNALKRFLSSKTNSCLVTGHASLVTSSCLRRWLSGTTL